MAKKTVKAIVKLQVPAGKATPAPPVGPALGPHGVQAAQFCQQFKKALGLEKGSGEPNKTKVGALTREKLRAIAEQKMPDLTAKDIEAAMKIIAGTARSMGVTVEG